MDQAVFNLILQNQNLILTLVLCPIKMDFLLLQTVENR